MPSSRTPLRKGSDSSSDTWTSESYSRSRRHDRHEEEKYVHSSSDNRRDRRDRQGSYDSDRRERRRRRREEEGEYRRYDENEDEDRQRRRERRARREMRRNIEKQRAGSHDEKIEDPFAPPPAYDQISRHPKDRLPRHSTDKHPSPDNQPDPESAQPTSSRTLSKVERFGGPFIYIIPLLTAFCLLAASTCSADWWRKDVNVIRLGLPGDVYARLLATGNNLGKGGETGSGTEQVDSGGKVQGRAAKISPQGWLSVGFWGWCVSPEGDGPWACSETDAWYTMDELLETAAVTSTIPTDAYFVGLMHGIMVHGLAMVATMAATVPAGILIWRRYIRNDKTIGPGLALHATMFSGSAFAFIAFIIDKALQARIGSQTKYPVKQGSVPIMTGTSGLLLFLAFLASVAPGIARRVKRQQEYAGSWEDVHAASELKRSISIGTTATGLTRSKTWGRMKRWTTYGGRGR